MIALGYHSLLITVPLHVYDVPESHFKVPELHRDGSIRNCRLPKGALNSFGHDAFLSKPSIESFRMARACAFAAGPPGCISIRISIPRPALPFARSN